MAIEYIDGIRLYRTLAAGLRRVVSRQDYLNKINVFPVPDGDTGTNIAFTLTSIEEGIQDKIYSNIHQTSMAIAHAKVEKLAKKWEAELMKNGGADKVILTEIGPALGVHAGRGALAVAIQTLDDDLNNE
jgi:fatty acid-binding protein DegV